MTLERWSWIASIVAGLLAVIGFPAIVWQLYMGRQQRADAVRLSTSQVLLAADGVLAAHADVAAKLRPLGEWHSSTTHPDASEMKLVEPYLGVFERIFIAVSAGQVADEIVDELYGYRLHNIWNNPQIVARKLQHNELKYRWKRIIALTYTVEAFRSTRFENHTDTYFPSELFDRRQTEYIRERLKEKRLGIHAKLVAPNVRQSRLRPSGRPASRTFTHCCT